MKLFPSVRALALADEQKVLSLWEGLGYYSRARNLHNAAKVVVKKYKGRLPDNRDDLLELPGVGRYTAGAILSLVYKKDEPALDGNLKRVYARLFNVREPINSQHGEKKLWEIAYKNIPRGKAGDFNQALMDLGSSVCIPKHPRCSICPVMGLCKTNKLGLQDVVPIKNKIKQSPHYVQAAAVIQKGKKLLLKQRPAKGLLGGLWEFPNVRVEGDPAKELTKAMQHELNLKVRKKESIGQFEHAYSHFSVSVHAFFCDVDAIPKKFSWVSISALDNYPMGKVDRQIARAVLKK